MRGSAIAAGGIFPQYINQLAGHPENSAELGLPCCRIAALEQKMFLHRLHLLRMRRWESYTV